jgi:hypothetical protein
VIPFTTKASIRTVLKLSGFVLVSCLLLGSQFVVEQHDCTGTTTEHASNCPICWISFSTGDVAFTSVDAPVLLVGTAETLPAPRPFISLPSLSADSRAPPAA